MLAEQVESSEAGFGDPYYEFALPIGLDALAGPEHAAFKLFCEDICRRLAAPSYSFQFDGAGRLRMLRLTATSDDTCVGIPPVRAFNAIRDIILGLGLESLPPIFERSGSGRQVAADIEMHRRQTWFHLDRLREWLRIKPKQGPDDRGKDEAVAEMVADDAHVHAQFSRLRTWLQAQWARGIPMAAICRRYGAGPAN